ncbi:RAD55 family ATPase [Halomicrobium salinisoli]|uniref:RAD55 family ATPase n=1 Tax=Halomicrobium salinisoli TaxID=2878391 RepID=UPI001CF01938|nr:HTR-like protein [Halomicrobium salinisoli]
MDRIPFGVRQFDTTIEGGAPRGSVVLLSGEAGAGSREFMYTSALMNALATSDDELFDLYYGDPAAGTALPGAVHYVSFTADESELGDEMRLAMDDDLVETGLPDISFHELSDHYFHVSPVPRDWYADEAMDIRDLRDRQEREDLLTVLGETLSAVAPGNLVVVDSLSDLVGAVGDVVDWSDVSYLVQGLQKAARQWNGLVLLHLNHDTVTDTQFGQLTDAVNGTIRFEWESGGSTRARTMIVSQFRGVLSRIEDENIVRFETEIGDAGFDISDVRKIR